MSAFEYHYFEFKRGMTFSGTVELESGEGDLDGVTVTSEIREKGSKELIDTVTITKFNDNTGFDFLVSDTNEWPICELNWDIKFTYTNTGEVVFTDTVVIDIVDNITE